MKEICALRKNASNVNVRKFAKCNKERRSHLQRKLKCVLGKQNLVFQHISDLCCYLLKLSWGIPYGIREWQNPTSKRSSYQNWDLHPLLRAFSANVLKSSLDNLGIGKRMNDYGTDSRTELDNHILLAAWYDWYMTYVAENSKDERRWLKLFP